MNFQTPLITCESFVSNLAIAQAKMDIDAFVLSDFKKQIAERIVIGRLEKKPIDYAMQYTVSVIVATPAEYWRDVECKAREIAAGRPVAI